MRLLQKWGEGILWSGGTVEMWLGEEEMRIEDKERRGEEAGELN